MNKERFTNPRDWWIALAIACGLILIPYMVYAEERYFAVTAYNDFGESGYSEEVISDLERGESVSLQWNAVDRATGYKVYWGKASRDYRPPIDVEDTTIHTIIQLDAPIVTIIGD